MYYIAKDRETHTHKIQRAVRRTKSNQYQIYYRCFLQCTVYKIRIFSMSYISS